MRKTIRRRLNETNERIYLLTIQHKVNSGKIPGKTHANRATRMKNNACLLLMMMNIERYLVWTKNCKSSKIGQNVWIFLTATIYPY